MGRKEIHAFFRRGTAVRDRRAGRCRFRRRTSPDKVVIATGVANDVLATWIDICPSSTKFCAGETLRFIVQGSDVYAYPGVGYEYPETINQGRHIIHTGGRYDSHLLIATVSPGH